MKDISTRRISGDAGVNDAYIYRYFKDMDDMLAQAYLQENDRFMRYVIGQIEQVQERWPRQDMKNCYELVFHSAWRYLIEKPDTCRFFVYYYNSRNFEKYAKKAYREQEAILAETIAHLFQREKDAVNCLHALFVLLVSFSVQVVDGNLPNFDEMEKWVCETTYNTLIAQVYQAK